MEKIRQEKIIAVVFKNPVPTSKLISYLMTKLNTQLTSCTFSDSAQNNIPKEVSNWCEHASKYLPGFTNFI